MSFLKLLGAVVMTATSIGILLVDYNDINRYGKAGLVGAIVANLVILLDHYRNYRKAKLFKIGRAHV